MSKSLQDLGLSDEPLPGGGQEIGDLPTFGGGGELPQPGPYRFKLPAEIDGEMLSTFTTQAGQRMAVRFSREHPLTIISSPNGGKLNGQRLDVRLSNVERARGRDKAIVASELDYLYGALGLKAKPKSNLAAAQWLQQQGGKEFGGDVTLSWRCRKDAAIRMDDGSGQLVEVKDANGQPVLGCGKGYYQRDVESLRDANGHYPERIECPTCRGVLRAFPNLENIRP